MENQGQNSSQGWEKWKTLGLNNSHGWDEEKTNGRIITNTVFSHSVFQVQPTTATAGGWRWTDAPRSSPNDGSLAQGIHGKW